MKCKDEQPPYFPKHQKIISKTYYIFIYFVFYFFPLHFLYSIITVDYHLIGFYVLIIALQTRVKKNQTYVHLLSNILQIRKAPKDITLRFEEEISPKEKCLFGIHPHGILVASMWTYMYFPNSPFEHIIGLSSRGMLNLPVLGLLLRLWGAQSVDPKNMKSLMEKEKNLMVVPGGYEEATLTVPDELRIYIKERKGFVKYALEHNYAIYPVLSINEHKMFWTFRYFLNFRLWLNKFKIPGVLYFNPLTFGGFPAIYMPYEAIIGRGIRGRYYYPGEKATSQELNQAHSKYIEQIVRMHNAYKQEIGTPLKIY